MPRLLLLLLPVVLALVLPACDVRPGGGTATVFRIDGKRRLVSAVLYPPASDEGRQSVRLRFTDDNTFQTNDPLPPGRYRLALRSDEGMYLSAEVELTDDRWFYRIPAPTEGGGPGPAASDSAAVAVTAQVADARRLPSQLVVLFAGKDVIVRRAAHDNGLVRVDAPGAGTWRVEIIAPGTPARTWSADAVVIDAGMTRVDLGAVELR